MNSSHNSFGRMFLSRFIILQGVVTRYLFVQKVVNCWFLKYEENYHVCKENENYGLLQAGVSQQILKVADRSFKSFFNLIKKAKSGEYIASRISTCLTIGKKAACST